jgi:hypothetical protein
LYLLPTFTVLKIVRKLFPQSNLKTMIRNLPWNLFNWEKMFVAKWQDHHKNKKHIFKILTVIYIYNELLWKPVCNILFYIRNIPISDLGFSTSSGFFDGEILRFLTRILKEMNLRNVKVRCVCTSPASFPCQYYYERKQFNKGYLIYTILSQKL